VTARLTSPGAQDAFLGALPPAFPAQTSHVECVLEPPDGAVPLAAAPRDTHFALRFAPRAWGVQFHPEFSAEVTRAYIRERRDELPGEGLDPKTLEAEVRETPEASALIERFLSGVSPGAKA
jgi:GMP synthase (glutamine-hydrolysing)